MTTAYFQVGTQYARRTQHNADPPLSLAAGVQGNNCAS